MKTHRTPEEIKAWSAFKKDLNEYFKQRKLKKDETVHSERKPFRGLKRTEAVKYDESDDYFETFKEINL